MVNRLISIRDDTKQSDNLCVGDPRGAIIHREYVNADGDLALEGKELDKHELKAEPMPPLEGHRKVQILCDAHASRSPATRLRFAL